MKTLLTIITALLASSAFAQTPIQADWKPVPDTPLDFNFDSMRSKPDAPTKFGLAYLYGDQRPKYDFREWIKETSPKAPAATATSVDVSVWRWEPNEWITNAIAAGAPLGVGMENAKKACENAYIMARGGKPFTGECIGRVAFGQQHYNSFDKINWKPAKIDCMIKLAIRNSRNGITNWYNVLAEQDYCQGDRKIAAYDVEIAKKAVEPTEITLFSEPSNPYSYIPSRSGTYTTTIIAGGRTTTYSTTISGNNSTTIVR